MLHSSGYGWAVSCVSRLPEAQPCCEANSWEENTGVLTQGGRSHHASRRPRHGPGSWGHSWPQRGSVQEGRPGARSLPSQRPCQGHSPAPTWTPHPKPPRSDSIHAQCPDQGWGHRLCDVTASCCRKANSLIKAKTSNAGRGHSFVGGFWEFPCPCTGLAVWPG